MSQNRTKAIKTASSPTNAVPAQVDADEIGDQWEARRIASAVIRAHARLDWARLSAWGLNDK